MYRYKNYSRTALPAAPFADGREFRDCNFSQAVPGTAIDFKGMDLTFEDCNFVNCKFVNDENCLFLSCNNAQIDLGPEPVLEPQPDIELAAYATAARAILAKSDKLQSPEITSYLDSLEAKQKEVAGINLPDGESATVLVRKMIDALILKGETDKANELQQALDMVVNMTGGVL